MVNFVAENKNNLVIISMDTLMSAKDHGDNYYAVSVQETRVTAW